MAFFSELKIRTVGKSLADYLRQRTTDREAMITLGQCLQVALVFSCIARCSSQSQCEAVDSEITYPDRCDDTRSKDLCRRGQYLKVSSLFCGGHGSAGDECVSCEVETYMPNYNFCTSCLETTKCKDNEIESVAPTSTKDRECIHNPITAPPVIPNCPVCPTQCPTQSSCPPCPTLQGPVTDLSSHTSTQGASMISPTTFTSSVTNATQGPVYLKGVEDFWKWLAIGLGIVLVVAILVIGVLVYKLCRTRGGRNRGAYIDGEYEMANRNPPNRAEGHPNPGQSYGNTTSMSAPPAGKDVSIQTNEESRSNDNGRNTPSTSPYQYVNRDTKTGNGPKGFPNKGQPNPSESMQPLMSNSSSDFGINDVSGGPARNPSPPLPCAYGDTKTGNGSKGFPNKGQPNPSESTQPLMSNSSSDFGINDVSGGPARNPSPPLPCAYGDTKTGNGSKGFPNKGQPNPSESMQPLLKSKSDFATNDFHSEDTMRTSPYASARYDSSCILEADESTEKPCDRTTFCGEWHINLVAEEISVSRRTQLFSKLHITSKKVEEVFFDKGDDGIREQIRAVLLSWLKAHEEHSIVNLLIALDLSGNADVSRVFQKKFNVKQIRK